MHLRGEEFPSVLPVVVCIVGLAEGAVHEERVQRQHRREDEVRQHDAHQVQVLHLKFIIIFMITRSCASVHTPKH